MPGASPYNPKAANTAGGSFLVWKDVHGYLTDASSPQPAKKAYIRNDDNTAWIEVWNARPELSSVTATAATHDVDESKITSSVNVNGHYLNTTVYFYYRVQNGTWNSVLVSNFTGSTIQNTAQTSSHIQYSLAENTTYEYYWYATNSGGTASTSISTITTPYNCTEGASGFASTTCTDCYEEQYEGCGICGYKTRSRSRTKYAKTGCTNTYYSGWSAYPDFSTISCPDGNGSYSNMIYDIPDTGTWYDYYTPHPYQKGTYYYFTDAIYRYPNSQCGIGGACCGGYQIKYYIPEKCDWTPTQRWTELGCFSVW